VQEEKDELNGFISPTVYLSRYVPKRACPSCKIRDWGRVTTFHATGKKWNGFIFCMNCNERYEWTLDPDKPIEWQSVYSDKPLKEKEE
jgi:hypothetical protein